MGQQRFISSSFGAELPKATRTIEIITTSSQKYSFLSILPAADSSLVQDFFIYKETHTVSFQVGEVEMPVRSFENEKKNNNIKTTEALKLR